MCGLVGFFNYKHLNGDPRSTLATMTKRLEHRGPDDSGLWLSQDDEIALGHRRLSILDISALGHQPMHSTNGRYVLAYNGEIYNFQDLKKQLELNGYAFSSHSDTEVILSLITEHGLRKALSLMSGMFAFALWDKKEKKLHLVRDRMGEKPMYYGLVNGSFVFASELKAICAYPGFNNPLQQKSLGLFLQYGYVPTPYSIYETIFKLTPGTYLSISQNDLPQLPAPEVYWSAVQTAQDGLANPLSLNDDEAIHQTEMRLKAIVNERMISDVPIGAFLSGGIDSSLITALMQANSQVPIKTFTIGFNAEAYNEAQYAKKIAAYLKTDHTELYIDSAQACAVIPNLPLIYDEPFADSSAIPMFLVSQLARQQVVVCLSGDGGDELFGGYNRYLLGKAIWSKLAVLPYPLRLLMRKLLLSVSPSRWHQVLKLSQIPMLADKLVKFAECMAVKSPDKLYQHLVSQWHNVGAILNSSVFDGRQPGLLLSQLDEVDFVEKMMITDSMTYLPDDIMVKLDRACMAVGLESRAPFLDHHLIELIWKLPLHMKIRNRKSKWLLRQVLSRYIPESLFDRPKMGFGIPLDAWLRGPLRDWAESLLTQESIEQHGLNAKPILTAWQEHLSGKRNWQYQLWTILMFQAWMERQ